MLPLIVLLYSGLGGAISARQKKPNMDSTSPPTSKKR
jgi:hypothetical protein